MVHHASCIFPLLLHILNIACLYFHILELQTLNGYLLCLRLITTTLHEHTTIPGSTKYAYQCCNIHINEPFWRLCLNTIICMRTIVRNTTIRARYQQMVSLCQVTPDKLASKWHASSKVQWKQKLDWLDGDKTMTTWYGGWNVEQWWWLHDTRSRVLDIYFSAKIKYVFYIWHDGQWSFGNSTTILNNNNKTDMT